MDQNTKSRRFLGYTTSVAVAVLVVYFSITAVQGPFGLRNLFKLEQREIELQAKLEQATEQRIAAQNRALRLSDQYLDLDLLDEQARKVLGYIRSNEIIIQ